MNRREFLKVGALFGSLATLAAVGIQVDGEPEFMPVFNQSGQLVKIDDSYEFFYDLDQDTIRSALILDDCETIKDTSGITLSFSVDRAKLFEAVKVWDNYGNEYQLKMNNTLVML